jgi:hypothetical protein
VDVGFRITGDGGVAVEDEVAMGNEASGVNLGDSKCGGYEGQKRNVLQMTQAKYGGARTVDIRPGLGRFAEKEHGCTSVLHRDMHRREKNLH